MIQIDAPSLPNLIKKNLIVNSLVEELSDSKDDDINDDIIISRICLEHHDRHKNCTIPIHRTILLYSIIKFLELIFINKRVNQIGIIPNELESSQRLNSKRINALTSPFLLRSLCKFTECQIAEITYRIKLFDKFRVELNKYRIMIDHASEYDSNNLNLQSKQVDQWFKIAFEGYNLWDKKNSYNSKRINQCDVIICNVKLKNILKTRKRMETIKRKKEISPQTFRFIPYSRPKSNK